MNMTKKEKLATEYIELKKEFDGADFKPGLTENQIWYLTREFRVIDLENKIASVKRAINDKEIRLKKEAYYATAEGQAYKANIENKIEEYHRTYRSVHDAFEKWIIDAVNKMVPGNWTARLSIGTYHSGHVEIGLVNRDPERNFPMQFGHEFEIYFDGYNYGKKSPRFDLNYGTLGSFDLFEDETRPVYLNGLATISNNKQFLQLLMAKFIENCNTIAELSKIGDNLKNQLENPNI